MRRLRRPNRHDSPARRTRKVHRRDSPRSGFYKPMVSDKNMARRGVQRRLLLGAGCAMVTVLTFITGLWMGGSFAMAAMMILSLCFLVATLAFVLSARREETVHLFANTPQPHLIADDGVDGTLEPTVRQV